MGDSLDTHTPTLRVSDSRGLVVREVAYLRSVTSEAPLPLSTRQVFDAAGNALEQWDARVATSQPDLTSTFSLSGRTLFTDHVDAGWRAELYADTGQVICRWDQRGSRQTIDYDSLGRAIAHHEQRCTDPAALTVERQFYADGSSQFAQHNQCGQRVRHLDPAGSLEVSEYALDSAVLQEQRRYLNTLDLPDWPASLEQQEAMLEPGRYETQWGYNATGDQIEQTNARHYQQRSRLNVAGQLAGLQLIAPGDAAQTLVQTLDYAANGQVQTQIAGNGVVTSWRFDPANGRRTEQRSVKGSVRHQCLTYDYDPVGNVTRVTDSAQASEFFSGQRVEPIRTFAYNTRYQLIRATGYESTGAGAQPQLPDLIPLSDRNRLRNYTQTYAYDQGENLTSLVHHSATSGQGYTLTMTIDPLSNRCLSWAKGAALRTTTFSYDADGNLQMLYPGAQKLAWTPRNQLQSVVLVSRKNAVNDDERYAYCAQGNRVRKVHSAWSATLIHVQETRYLPGLDIKAVGGDEQCHVTSLQTPAGPIRFLHWVQALPHGVENNPLRYGLHDHLGSTALELSGDATVITHEGYYPFGGTAWWAAVSQVQADCKTIRYSNKERDHSGLYYFGARYYAPWLMRWISPDPAGSVDGLNLYAMLRNNPMSYVDPTGLARSRLDYLDLAAGPAPDRVRESALAANSSLADHFDTFIEATDHMMRTAESFAAHTRGLGGAQRRKVIAENNLDPKSDLELLKPKLAHAGYTASGHTLAQNHFYNFPVKSVGFPGTEYVRAMNDKEVATRSAMRKSMPIPGFKGAPALPITLSQAHPHVEVTDLDAMIGAVKNVYGQNHVQMHPFTEQRIRAHVKDSHYLLPYRAGIPGTHAEVLAQNDLLHRLDASGLGIATAMRDAAMYTVRITPPNREFPSCDHCSGIVSPLIHVITGLTEVNRLTTAPIASRIRRLSI